MPNGEVRFMDRGRRDPVEQYTNGGGACITTTNEQFSRTALNKILILRLDL